MKSWRQVNSSFIKAVAYDKALDVLSVKLRGDSVYSFKDVPKDVYKDFLASVSKGQFFNNNLKDKYSWTKE